MFNGKLAWDAILDFHNDPSIQNKLMAVISLLTLKQLPDESILDFKLRLQKVFKRIESLAVTMKDLMAVKFLTGLLPKYEAIVNTISVKGGDIKLEDIFKSVQQFDQREEMARAENETATANSAISKVVPAVHAPAQKSAGEPVLMSKKEVANFVKQQMSSLQRKKPQEARTSGSNNDDQPTEKEREMTCYRCNKKGHTKRTCRVKQTSYEPGPGGKKRQEKRNRANMAQEDHEQDNEEPEPKAHAFMAQEAYPDTDGSKPADPDSMDMFADSGASKHMADLLKVNLKHFTNLVRFVTPVVTASGAILKSVWKGDYGSMKNVLLIPGLKHALFSISAALSTFHYAAVFTCKGFGLYKSSQVKIEGSPVVSGPRVNGIY